MRSSPRVQRRSRATALGSGVAQRSSASRGDSRVALAHAALWTSTAAPTVAAPYADRRTRRPKDRQCSLRRGRGHGHGYRPFAWPRNALSLHTAYAAALMHDGDMLHACSSTDAAWPWPRHAQLVLGATDPCSAAQERSGSVASWPCPQHLPRPPPARHGRSADPAPA